MLSTLLGIHSHRYYILLCITMIIGHSAEIINTESSKNTHRISTIIATGNKLKTYQSGNKLSNQILNASPSGNGDITSVLRAIPNVQFDNSQLKSSTPGEIDPANISISGGLFYQNNFQLDGMNINNDLDPNGGSTNGPNALRSGRSQGLAVDTSLLDSIIVQDSNISAAYGGFTGGVVEANVRKPRRDKGGIYGWHGSLSYQFTGSSLTQYFIDASQEQNFITSSNENYQPNFTKHLVRANIEGYASENLGIIASFSTTRSFIPLKAYSFDVGAQASESRDQNRTIDNYYIKTTYNPSEKLTLEASLAYMPQDNTYYNAVAKDSFYRMQSGGVQSGLKALYDSTLGLWSNTLSYSFMQNSRKSDKNYFMSWRYAVGDKDWASASARGVASEGGYGDMDQLQNTLNYKSELALESYEWWKSSNRFRIGLEASYTNALRNRLNSYYAFSQPQNLNGATCGTDSLFDFSTCSEATTSNGWKGQYFNKFSESKPTEIKIDNFAYGLYGEDSIMIDLESAGRFSARIGLRLDGDSYMAKHTLAPRFSLSYTAPYNELWGVRASTLLTFGVNRYYGRNLLSYRLYDLILNSTTTYTRQDSNSSWIESADKAGSASYDFRGLNVPYADEVMVGFTQNLGSFSLVWKYIYRGGRDEVMRESVKSGTSVVTTWSNKGKSESHIITLSLQNSAPLELFGVKNFVLCAFDWSNVVRSYNLYAADDAYLDNDEILYNGQLIRYQDRPVDNFARPYTLRLTTTHSFSFKRSKWLLTNFFRYRAGYDSMVLLNKNSAGYNPAYPNTSQYGRMHFNGAFTWDIRLGVSMRVWRDSEAFINVDIYNVLNSKNMAALGGVNGATIPGIPTSASVVVYEIGRQFWIQGGVRF